MTQPLLKYAEQVFNNPEVWSYVLSEEPSLKDRVIAFFKGSPKRYSFALEMDRAAKKWIQEYKKLFDQVARYNAGENVAENVNTVTRNEQIKRIGKLVDELGGGAATQVPKSVIKRIGKVVPEGNSEFEIRNWIAHQKRSRSLVNLLIAIKKPPPAQKRCRIAGRGLRLL